MVVTSVSGASSKRASLACVVVAGDELDLLPECLECLGLADQIVILDRGISSQIEALGRKYGATVVAVGDAPTATPLRDKAADATGADWLFHVDPDERVQPQLFNDLVPFLNDPGAAAYRLPYQTVCFGRSLDHSFRHGQKLAMFRRGSAHWGDVLDPHKEPEVQGTTVDLIGRVTPIQHLVFRSIDQALEKTLRYGRYIDAPQDPLVLLRMAFRRFVLDEAWRDGAAGMATATLTSVGDALASLYAWERAGYNEQTISPNEHRVLALARSARRATRLLSRR